MRQFQFRVGHDNFALIHVSLVPDMHGEQKTKPTQTTVHALRGLGLLPDLVSEALLSIGALDIAWRSHAACWAVHLLNPRQRTKSRCSATSRRSR